MHSLPRILSLSLTRMKAIDVLSAYLTSSPTAPLNKEFVEIESPLWYVLFPSPRR
jgi:Zn-dependent M16 (insulinase) family peptidase